MPLGRYGFRLLGLSAFPGAVIGEKQSGPGHQGYLRCFGHIPTALANAAHGIGRKGKAVYQGIAAIAQHQCGLFCAIFPNEPENQLRDAVTIHVCQRELRHGYGHFLCRPIGFTVPLNVVRLLFRCQEGALILQNIPEPVQYRLFLTGIHAVIVLESQIDGDHLQAILCLADPDLTIPQADSLPVAEHTPAGLPPDGCQEIFAARSFLKQADQCFLALYLFAVDKYRELGLLGKGLPIPCQNGLPHRPGKGLHRMGRKIRSHTVKIRRGGFLPLGGGHCRFV